MFIRVSEYLRNECVCVYEWIRTVGEKEKSILGKLCKCECASVSVLDILIRLAGVIRPTNPPVGCERTGECGCLIVACLFVDDWRVCAEVPLRYLMSLIALPALSLLVRFHKSNLFPCQKRMGESRVLVYSLSGVNCEVRSLILYFHRRYLM